MAKTELKILKIKLVKNSGLTPVTLENESLSASGDEDNNSWFFLARVSPSFSRFRFRSSP